MKDDLKTAIRKSDVVIDHIGRFDVGLLGTVRDATIKNDEALLQIDASHAGVITRNGMFYSPKKMRDGVKTFTKPYNIPILVNHDMEVTPFGRVVDAEYADFTRIYRDDNLTGMVSATLRAKKDEAHNKAATELYNLLDQKGFLADFGNKYSGLGAARIYMKIVDPAALEKIKDGRFDTMSVSFGRGNLWCMDCAGYAMSDDCEHGFFDDNVLMPDKHAFIETSFVNAPADILAKISNEPDYPNLSYLAANSDSARHIVDGIERETIILGNKTVLSAESVEDVAVVKTEEIKDTQVIEQTVEDTGEDMKKKNKEVPAESTVVDEVVIVDDVVATVETVVADEAAPVIETAPIEAPAETVVADEVVEKPMLIDILSKDSYIAAVNAYIDSMSDEEKAKMETLRLTAELTDTATFCGPNESFIVVDEGHIAIAQALLDSHDGPKKEKISKKLADKKAELDAAKALSVNTEEAVADETTTGEPAVDGAKWFVNFDTALVDQFGKEDKQKIFDYLYDLCSDSNKSIKQIKQENIMLKFDVDAYSDTTAQVEDKFNELYAKVKPLIVDSIVGNEIAFGKAEKSELEQKTSDYMALDSVQVLDKFDFFSKMQDNKSVEPDAIGVSGDNKQKDSVVDPIVETVVNPAAPNKQNKSKNLAVKDLVVDKKLLAELDRDWKN